MAIAFQNVKAYLGRYDYTGKSNKMTLDYSVDEKPVPVLDSATAILTAGLMKVAANLEGYQDLGDVSGANLETVYTEPLLYAAVGEATPLPYTFSAGPTGGADGGPVCFFQALRFGFSPIEGGVGDIHPFKLNASTGAGRLVSGKIALPKATYAAASGSGTAYQLGAVPAGKKLYAALHVFKVAAGGSVVFKVQSDIVGFASPTDVLTFTAATDRTEQWLELAGPTTDDYFRANYTRTGGTDFKAALVFGIGPA
jgi:hypothetical protein